MKRTLTVLGIVLLVAVFAYPVFGRGFGWGGGYMMGNWGGGPGYGGNYNTYNRGYGNLTEDQTKQLEALDRKFSDRTADLRDKLWTKSGELNTLMNSANPDPARVQSLQKEITDLRARLDKEGTEYALEARKITPDTRFGRGYGYGGGPFYGFMRGYGMRGYGMMGRGGYGPGACWN